MTWMDQAACIGMAPHFDDEFITSRHIIVCSECPVVVQCLDEALHHHRHDDFGIWGGTDKAQRRLIRRGLVSVQDVWLSNLEVADEELRGVLPDDDGADLAGLG